MWGFSLMTQVVSNNSVIYFLSYSIVLFLHWSRQSFSSSLIFLTTGLLSWSISSFQKGVRLSSKEQSAVSNVAFLSCFFSLIFFATLVSTSWVFPSPTLFLFSRNFYFNISLCPAFLCPSLSCLVSIVTRKCRHNLLFLVSQTSY